MNARRCIGGALLMLMSLAGAGCGTGISSELGGIVSYLDSDDLGQGYGAGAKLEIKPNEMVSVDGRVSWIYFNDGEAHMIPLEIVGRVNWSYWDGRIVPYIGIGGGYYLFEGSNVELDDSAGLFPLIGLEVGRRQAALFAEARWLFLNADVDDPGDQLGNRSEADLDGFGLNLGVLYRF
jgi:outer membrane protein W